MSRQCEMNRTAWRYKCTCMLFSKVKAHIVLSLQVVAQTDQSQSLLASILRVILHGLNTNQSTSLLQHLFAVQRSLVRFAVGDNFLSKHLICCINLNHLTELTLHLTFAHSIVLHCHFHICVLSVFSTLEGVQVSQPSLWRGHRTLCSPLQESPQALLFLHICCQITGIYFILML